jgi:hypothetical protein
LFLPGKSSERAQKAEDEEADDRGDLATTIVLLPTGSLVFAPSFAFHSCCLSAKWAREYNQAPPKQAPTALTAVALRACSVLEVALATRQAN